MHNLNNLQKSLVKEDDEAKQVYYNDGFSIHKIMQRHHDIMMNNILDNKIHLSIAFEELAEYYLMSGLYAKEFCHSDHKTNELLTIASYYSYGLLVFFNKKCAGTHTSIVLMRKSIYLWSSLFLVGWDEKAMRVGSELLDSLNKKGSIIRYGNRLSPEAWFLIDIYSLATKKAYDKTLVDYPENMHPYTEILEDWDTEDLEKIDFYITILCNAHLKLKNIDEYELDDEYMNFYKSIMKLYPYIVIGYLAIRKQAGLKSPIEFSHPLMQIPIVKMFLSIKQPLETPKHIPYASELMTKLKEICPDFKTDNSETIEANDIAQDTTFTSPIKGDNSIPDDFFKDE